MKSSDEIYMDFMIARQAAEEIEELSYRLRKSADRIADNIKDLSGHWNGEEADQFYTKGENLSGKVNISAKWLSEYAKAIRNDAKRLYDKEMRAIEIASKRES